MSLPVKHYYYRGPVERGRSYRTYNGYSPIPEEQPWLTFKECHAQAKRDGFKAVIHLTETI